MSMSVCVRENVCACVCVKGCVGNGGEVRVCMHACRDNACIHI